MQTLDFGLLIIPTFFKKHSKHDTSRPHNHINIMFSINKLL